MQCGLKHLVSYILPKEEPFCFVYHAQVLKTESNIAQPHNKYDAKHPKQLQVTDALVDFVAEDLMPLCLVDSLQLQKLLKSLDPQYYLPSRKLLSKTLLTQIPD